MDDRHHQTTASTGRETTINRRCFTALALTALSGAPPAWAQDGQPINLIVPYPAGGPSDVGARRLAPELAKALNQTVVVQNMAGAGGAIAAQRLLQLPADGRTMLYGSPNELVLVPALNPAVKYKPHEFAPVGLSTRTPMVLVARTGLPVKTVDELVQYAKAQAGRELTYGSVGPGSLQHVLGAHVAALLGVKMLHVPYKGSAPMNNDLMGQQVDLAVTPLSGGTIGYVDGGKMRSLGLLTLERSPLAPNLTTVQDNSALKGVNFTIWGGLFVPASTPSTVLSPLQAAFRTMISVASLREAIAAGGGEAFPAMAAADTLALYRDDAAHYAKLVKDLDIRIDS